MLQFDEAIATLLSYTDAIAAFEEVSTFDADGRVLAQDIVSELQVPPHDNSAMDGYAVRCADLTEANTVLPVSQRIPAGSSGQPLAARSVARIFTGAPIPSGADAVVMQEDCETLNAPAGGVMIKQHPKPGQWIRRSGEDVCKGAVVIAKGERLTPALLGLAASVGLGRLQVTRRPRVALFSTGDELCMPGEVAPQDMPLGAIYNSNRFFLSTLLKRLGCDVSDMGIVPDQRDATIQTIKQAAQHHDLILSSGGVSVGEEDHVKSAVMALGRLDLWQLAIKPGKPFVYGSVQQCHFMGLPGNPVSSYVTFLLLVRPFILKLQGASKIEPKLLLLPAHFEWLQPDKRREFLRVRINSSGGLDLFHNQSSGVLTSVAWADGLVDNPGGKSIHRGEWVQFLALEELM